MGFPTNLAEIAQAIDAAINSGTAITIDSSKNVTAAAALTVTTGFTHNGSVTTGGNYSSDDDTSFRVFSGGSAINVGANIRLYGSTHATKANDIELRNSTTNLLAYDASATTWLVSNNLSMQDNKIIRAELDDYSLSHSAPTISSGAITFDYTVSQSFYVSLTANVTSITLSNPPASGNYGEIVIEFLQDGTGGRTVTGWPASVKWAGGTAPTITTTLTTGRDKIFLSTRDGGTTWLGDYSQDYS